MVSYLSSRRSHRRLGSLTCTLPTEIKKYILTFLLEQTKRKYLNLVFVHTVNAKGSLNDGPKDESVSDALISTGVASLIPPHTLTAISLRGESLGPLYNRESGITTAEETGQIIAFERE